MHFRVYLYTTILIVFMNFVTGVSVIRGEQIGMNIPKTTYMNAPI